MNKFLLTSSILMTIPIVVMADSTTRLGCDSDINGDVVVDVSDVRDRLGLEFPVPRHRWRWKLRRVRNPPGAGRVRSDLPSIREQCRCRHGLRRRGCHRRHGLWSRGPCDGAIRWQWYACNNPNTPTDQNFEWRIPLNPVRTNNPAVDLLNTLGAVGVSLNGVSVYNPYDGGGVDAPSTICMDDFNGHPSPDGSYHYHQASDWCMNPMPRVIQS